VKDPLLFNIIIKILITLAIIFQVNCVKQKFFSEKEIPEIIRKQK